MIHVYVKEAHASDVWPIGSKYSIAEPKSNDERIAAAKQLIQKDQYQIPIYVDPITVDSQHVSSSTNPFLTTYSPWPLRWYLFDKHHRIVYQSEPTHGNVAIQEVEEVVMQHLHSTV
jgi:hypothetical protein